MIKLLFNKIYYRIDNEKKYFDVSDISNYHNELFDNDKLDPFLITKCNSKVFNYYKSLKSSFCNNYYNYYFLKYYYGFNTFPKESVYSLYGFDFLSSLTFYDYCNENNIKYTKNINYYISYIIKYISPIYYLFLQIPLFFYLLVKIFIKGYNDVLNNNHYEHIYLLLCGSSIRKLKTFDDTLNNNNTKIFLYDDFRMSKTSGLIGFISVIPRMQRFILLLKSFSLSEFYAEYSCLNGVFFNNYNFLPYFFKRILYSKFQKNCFNYIFDNYSFGTLYSGSVNEWYAINLSVCAKKHMVKTVCIPHGSCITIEQPSGIFGDKIFTLTESESMILSKLYSNQDFYFNSKFASQLMRCCSENVNCLESKVVFFTDNRSITRDQYIIDFLSLRLKLFYLKLHPNDSEFNYKIPSNCKILDSFTDSICNMVCITRVSSVLIDACYNNSKSVSLLFFKEDIFEFNFVYMGKLNKNIIIFKSEKAFLKKIKGIVDD